LPSREQAGSVMNQPARCAADLRSGKWLVDDESNRLTRPASLAKLMTAYLALREIGAGRLSFAQEVIVSDFAASKGGSTAELQPGQRVTIYDLLAWCFVVSGNDAATTLAEAVAGDADSFVERMNETAAEIGLRKTRYGTPSGLKSPGQQTTARDQVRMGRRLLLDFPVSRQFAALPMVLVGGEPKYNTNRLIGRHPGVVGLKTGTLRPATCHLAIFARGRNRAVVGCVMDCNTKAERDEVAAALVDGLLG
jgi:D-alanyl-D-alanine carboxypeptidase